MSSESSRAVQGPGRDEWLVVALADEQDADALGPEIDTDPSDVPSYVAHHPVDPGDASRQVDQRCANAWRSSRKARWRRS